jgi:hypothetical protein
MSHRMQITLDDEQYEVLVAESRRTGASIAELVRRSVAVRHGQRSTADRLAVLESVAGAWGPGDDGLTEQTRRRAKRHQG